MTRISTPTTKRRALQLLKIFHVTQKVSPSLWTKEGTILPPLPEINRASCQYWSVEMSIDDRDKASQAT